MTGYNADGSGRICLIGQDEKLRDVTNVTGKQHMYCLGRNEAFIRLFGDVHLSLEGVGPKPQSKKFRSTVDPQKITLQAAVDFSICYLEFVWRLNGMRNAGHNTVGGDINVCVIHHRGTSAQHRIGFYGLHKKDYQSNVREAT